MFYSPEGIRSSPVDLSETCTTCKDHDCLEIEDSLSGDTRISVAGRKYGDTLIGDAPPGTDWPEKELECYEDAPTYLKFLETINTLISRRTIDDSPDTFYPAQAKAAEQVKAWWIKFPCLRSKIRSEVFNFLQSSRIPQDTKEHKVTEEEKAAARDRELRNKEAAASVQQLIDEGDLDLPVPAPLGPVLSPREQMERGAAGGVLGGSAVALAAAKYDASIDAKKLESQFNLALSAATIDDIRVAMMFIRHWLDAEAKKGPQGEEVRPVCVRGTDTVLSVDELKKRLKLLENALIEKLRKALMSKSRAGWSEAANKNAKFYAKDVQADAKLVVKVIDLLNMGNGRDRDYLGLSEQLKSVDEAAPSQPKEGDPYWPDGNARQQDKPRALIEALEAIERKLQ